MNRTIIYTRNLGSIGSADFANKRQREAAVATGVLHGLISKDERGKPVFDNVGMFAEPVASSDRLYTQVLSTLEPTDTLIVSTLAVFGSEPSRMIANLSKAIATGSRIVVADMQSVDMATIRQVATAFTPLEETIVKLNAEIDQLYSSRAATMASYAKEIQRQIMDKLFSKGFDLTALIDPEGKPAKKPVDPIKGKQLKRLREQLELTGKQAGELAEAIGQKALSQSDVSQIENGHETGPKADIYETALRAEVAKHKAQWKADQVAVTKPSVATGGQPLTTTEQLVAKVVYDGEVLNG